MFWLIDKGYSYHEAISKDFINVNVYDNNNGKHEDLIFMLNFYITDGVIHFCHYTGSNKLKKEVLYNVKFISIAQAIKFIHEIVKHYLY